MLRKKEEAGMFTVTFLGHRLVEDVPSVERMLDDYLDVLLKREGWVECLVGKNGMFDQLASSAVRRAKRKNGDRVLLTLVLPYETAEHRENVEGYQAYYDAVEVFGGVHFKRAFEERNRTMIERADAVVCYVNTAKGGAYRALHYAQRQGKTVCNLGALSTVIRPKLV